MGLYKQVFSKKEINRILIFRYGQLGDTIVALPSIRVVRENFPNATITLLRDIHEGKGWVGVDQVLPSRLINRVITYEANTSGISIMNAIRLLPRIRAEHFDLLVYLVPRLRNRFSILRDLIFFRLAGIKRIVGHKGFTGLPKVKGWGSPLPQVQHEADHLLERLKISGIGDGLNHHDLFDLELTNEEHFEAQKWLLSKGLNKTLYPFVAFGPGSKWPSKRWPEERFKALGKLLLSEFQFVPIIVGGPEDHEIGNRLIRAWGYGFNAAGELSVRGSAALLKLCVFFIGNDTGTMHLAAAVSTPCVAIFSAQDLPGKWYPYGSGHIVIRKHPPCEGCKLVECVKNSIKCLLDISVEEVFAACREMMMKINCKCGNLHS